MGTVYPKYIQIWYKLRFICHIIDLTFLCILCERSYKSQSALKKHERYKHSDSRFVNVYICEECLTECAQAYTLKEHFWDIHSKKVDIQYAHSLVKKRRVTKKRAPILPPPKKKRVYIVI